MALSRFRWTLATSCLTLLFLLTGCRQSVPVVKVGLVAPFEGRHRAVGYDAVYAARLAIREFNQAAEGRSFRAALVPLDDSGEPRRAREAAASFATDADVVVVLGHWLPSTTEAAAPLYQGANLPLVTLGVPPLAEVDPAELPASFLAGYEEATPFGETAGPYAGATYDGILLVLTALEVAESNGALTREGVAAALDRLQYEGLTGTVFSP